MKTAFALILTTLAVFAGTGCAADHADDSTPATDASEVVGLADRHERAGFQRLNHRAQRITDDGCGG